MPNTEIIICKDADAISTEAATRFVEAARGATRRDGMFSVALSGGSTPRKLFEKLASPEWQSKVDWNAVQLFWSDERSVSPDDKDSNYRMARESLITRVAIPDANIHRIHGERAATDDAEAARAASDYESEIRRVLRTPQNEMPRFDLILLGMGADGHTASLFPGTTALDETERAVASLYVERLETRRVTFTFPLLNYAAQVMFLISGADKSGTLREVLQPEDDKVTYPSQRVRPINGKLTWLIDEAAASELNRDALREIS